MQWCCRLFCLSAIFFLLHFVVACLLLYPFLFFYTDVIAVFLFIRWSCKQAHYFWAFWAIFIRISLCFTMGLKYFSLGSKTLAYVLRFVFDPLCTPQDKSSLKRLCTHVMCINFIHKGWGLQINVKLNLLSPSIAASTS